MSTENAGRKVRKWKLVPIVVTLSRCVDYMCTMRRDTAKIIEETRNH